MSSSKPKFSPVQKSKRGRGQPPRVPRNVPENRLESLEDIMVEHRNIRNWLLRGELSERIAGTAIHNLEALTKVMMPSDIQEGLYELRRKAEDTERALQSLREVE